jgi:hypothetical protein
LTPKHPTAAARDDGPDTLYRLDIYANDSEIDGRAANVHGRRQRSSCALGGFGLIRQGMAELPDEIIIETVTVGGCQRVTAMDPSSLVEVVFQAPLSADLADIQRLARQKLAYRHGKRAGQGRPPPERGGILV